MEAGFRSVSAFTKIIKEKLLFLYAKVRQHKSPGILHLEQVISDVLSFQKCILLKFLSQFINSIQ